MRKELPTIETTTKTDELIAHLKATATTAKLGERNGLVFPEKIR
jgi:hypothetical protein